MVYDVVVIGAGWGGMTAANQLAKAGYSVVLLEQHHKLGGLATWFSRKRGHIFDVALHGFPVGMIKSCRKYWTPEIAGKIVQLRGIRFDNPQFSLTTTYDMADFKRILHDHFKISDQVINEFFTVTRSMNHYDDQSMTTQELFDRFFPGRDDVVRLLMEPITYANGSSLDDPALTYSIVFSNFMSKGVYTFRGGTDSLMKDLENELLRNKVDIRKSHLAQKILVKDKKVAGVIANGKEFRCRSVVSNANLKTTIHEMVGDEHFSPEFVAESRKVRLNNSSCQVYIGLRKGETLDYIGDLIFSSVADKFDYKAICSRNITSRTFSIYYPDMRPGLDRCSIVASSNANYEDWAHLSEEEYKRSKEDLIETTLVSLEKYVPALRQKLDYVEAATPLTFKRYTLHEKGASFGTKFEGLKISTEISRQISGLFHTGSVGIIMSGWLGAVNYGVIVANAVDKYLSSGAD